MRRLIFVAGLPGSGKSTWCRAYLKDHPGAHVVSSDETRKKMTGSYLVFPDEPMAVYDRMIEITNGILSKEEECTVIEDSTFLDDDRRLYFLNRIKGYDEAELVLIKMHDPRKCLERNKARAREKWVPEETIEEMASRYKDPSPEVRKLFKKVTVVYSD